MHQRVDRIPFEAIIGWDASGNGNLAQVLQEPTLMGAYEGAGITVLGRGVRDSRTAAPTSGASMPPAARVRSPTAASISATAPPIARRKHGSANGRDYGTGNFFCNPSRIDGVSVINSSQGGGGMFIHGWAHNLEVANTRISGNHGTLAGAINLGNGETPDAFINDGVECGVNPPGCLPADVRAAISQRHRSTERGDSVPVQHQRAHPPQHALQQRVDRRRAVLGHAGGRRRDHGQRRRGRLPDRPQLDRRQPLARATAVACSTWA